MEHPWMFLFAFGISQTLFGAALPASPATLKPLTLEEVLTRGREQNPDVKAAYQAWKVKTADVRPAGTWENPTFTYVDESFPSTSADVPTQKVRHYRIEQMIPFPGKLTQESRMKYHEALIAEADYRAKFLEILGEIRQRFYQLYLTDQKKILAQQSVDIMKDALRTAQGRLGSNQSSTSDIYMAETELGKMNNELFQAQQERTLVEIELNTLLNQPIDSPLGLAQAPELKDIPVGVADLEAVAHLRDPAYLSAVHEANHARSMRARNRLNFAPDFGLMFEREETPGGNGGRQIGVSVSVPLWLERPWGQYQSAQAHIIEAEAKSQGIRNEVDRSVHMEYVKTSTYLHLTRNFISDILPAASSNVKIARQQYASGQGDFVRLLDAFRTWIDVHNNYEDQLYQYAEHWSELERWTGVSLENAKDSLEKKESLPMEMPHAN